MKNKFLLLLVGFTTLISCNDDDNNIDDSISTSFPESIISYNFPLGTSNIEGQSPISITTAATQRINTVDPIIHFNTITLSNVEHTADNLKVNLSETDKTNNYITIKGYRYELQQFHFHYHSEHNINGEFGTMEIHFVHKSETGAYAVLGVLVKNGVTNSKLQTLFDASPTTVGTSTLTDSFDLNTILPSDTSRYYTYSGSLTTPNLDLTPNQGPLTWVVFKNQIEMTTTQLDDYATKYEEENYRVIQPINNRTVYENKKE